MDSLGKSNVSRRLSLSLCNAQSIKAKEEVVAEVLEDTKSDIMVVTETWLKDDDKVWIKSTELLRPSYRMLTTNRKGKRGGGIALICKSTLKTKHIRAGTKRSFEYSIWSIQTTNQAICLVAIYRPPDLSLPWFLDDFTEFMVDIIADSSNIVVMVDFNIHVNCDDDHNAVIFSDTMKAIGLHQHVTGPTHRSGNTLDLIFTEELSKIKLKSCKSTVFVSDHTAVHCILDIQYDEPSKQEMTFRKLSSINIEKFIEDIQIISLYIEDLNTLVSGLEMGLRSTLDLNAPELTKFITVRKKKLWYNEELRKNMM